MHVFLRLSRCLVLVALLISPVFAFAMPVGSAQRTASVPVPDGLAAPTVQEAILPAGTGRGWAVQVKDAAQGVLLLDHGGSHFLTGDITKRLGEASYGK
jgi:hypothetical protein